MQCPLLSLAYGPQLASLDQPGGRATRHVLPVSRIEEPRCLSYLLCKDASSLATKICSYTIILHNIIEQACQASLMMKQLFIVVQGTPFVWQPTHVTVTQDQMHAVISVARLCVRTVTHL